MTEGNTTKTLHNDSWEYIVTVLESDGVNPERSQTIANTINAQ